MFHVKHWDSNPSYNPGERAYTTQPDPGLLQTVRKRPPPAAARRRPQSVTLATHAPP